MANFTHFRDIAGNGFGPCWERGLEEEDYALRRRSEHLDQYRIAALGEDAVGWSPVHCGVESRTVRPPAAPGRENRMHTAGQRRNRRAGPDDARDRWNLGRAWKRGCRSAGSGRAGPPGRTRGTAGLHAAASLA